MTRGSHGRPRREVCPPRGLSDQGWGPAVQYTRGVTTRGTSAPSGWFITLEGPDGAGKTRQAQAIHSRLEQAGLPVTLVREPGGTILGERIRDLLLERGGSGTIQPLTDALLFNAARAQLVSEVIRPALARGEVVLCTRFADSTLAYQGYGAGLPIDDLRALERLATGGLTPDLTVLLDVPVESGLARKSADELTRFEAGFDDAFHRRVRSGFLELARHDPARFVVVDAAPPAEEVFEAIRTALVQRIPELAGPLEGARAAAWTDRPPAGRRGADEPESRPVRTRR
jgi:dTMP kinase